MVRARANMSFTGMGITMRANEEKDISDEKIFLDLHQAGFVQQIDRVSQDVKVTEKKAKKA